MSSTTSTQHIDPRTDPVAWLKEQSKPGEADLGECGINQLRPQLCALAAAGASQAQQIRWLAAVGKRVNHGNLSKWWSRQRAILREAGFADTDFAILSNLGCASFRKTQAVALLKNTKLEREPAEIPVAEITGQAQAPRSGQPASVPTAPPLKATSAAEKKGVLKNMMHEMQQELVTGVKPRSSLLPPKPGATGSDNSGT